MKHEYLHIRPDFTGLPESIDEKYTFFGVLNRFYSYDITGDGKTEIGGISKNFENTISDILHSRLP